MSQGLLFKNELLSKNKIFGGGGKYDVGDSLSLINTSAKKAVIQPMNFTYGAGPFGEVLFEDNTNVYAAYSNGGANLLIINKQTEAYAISNALTGGAVVAAYSQNDGYVYVLTTTRIQKIKLSDNTVVYTITINDSSAMDGLLKIINDKLYVVYQSSSGNAINYVSITLTSETTYTKNSEIQLDYRTTYPPKNLFFKSDNTFYFNSNNFEYKYNLLTGTLISSTANLYGYSAYDYLRGVAYNSTTSYIQCVNPYTNAVIWTYTHNMGVVLTLTVLYDGVLANYVSSYYSLRLNTDGSLLYKLGSSDFSNICKTHVRMDMRPTSFLVKRTWSGGSSYELLRVLEKLNIEK
ncbi:MAG: hypothetical protein AB6733_12065 [Clostridiaceae bacterium]